MSVYGMQLPKQHRVQTKTGPVEKNAQGTGASVYDSPVGKRTQSFQWKQHQQPRPDLYQKIQSGKGTVISDHYIKTGNCFDVTLRNNQHPFHSTGIRQVEFNNQRLDKIKENSRFKSPEKMNENPMDEKMYYDIKGNTFKNTLIPEETAKNAFNVKKFSQTMQNFTRSNSQSKVIPKYKGYIRSGAILFNNINQQNTGDLSTPKATKRKAEQFTAHGKHSQSVDQEILGSQIKGNSYQRWVNTSTKASTDRLAPYMGNSSRYSEKKLPQKHLEHIRQTLGQANAYSPDFQLQKMNNYDNTFKNIPRNILDNYDVSKYYHNKNPSENLSQDGNIKVSLGSSMGPGNRAVLYAAIPKQLDSPQRNKSSALGKTSPGKEKGDKGDYLETHIQNYKDWHHYDSNINNQLEHHKKVVNSKNYELDQRAIGIHSYGYQPIYDKHLDNKRKVDGIMLSQAGGKNPEERLPAYRKKFTPITTYMKSLHDSRITNMYGGKLNLLRPNLNYS